MKHQFPAREAFIGLEGFLFEEPIKTLRNAPPKGQPANSEFWKGLKIFTHALRVLKPQNFYKILKPTCFSVPNS